MNRNQNQKVQFSIFFSIFNFFSGKSIQFCLLSLGNMMAIMEMLNKYKEEESGSGSGKIGPDSPLEVNKSKY